MVGKTAVNIKWANEAFSRGDRDANVGESSCLAEENTVDDAFELTSLPSAFPSSHGGVYSQSIRNSLAVVHKAANGGDVLREVERKIVKLGRRK